MGQQQVKGSRNMADNQAATLQNDEMTIMTTESRVSCNGGGGALGHPQIWLTIGGDNKVTCPYCSRQFVKTNEST